MPIEQMQDFLICRLLFLVRNPVLGNGEIGFKLKPKVPINVAFYYKSYII